MKGKFCSKEENDRAEDDEQKPVRMPRMVVLTHIKLMDLQWLVFTL